MRCHIFALLVFFSILVCGAAHATNVVEVTSPGGIKAWLVEDHKLPLVSMQFAFRGGVEQDTADKQGLAELTLSLLNEGAGSYDAAAFQQALADHAVTMRFAAGRDALQGSVKFLSEEKTTALNLLHLALTQARFDEKQLAQVKDAQLSSLRAQLGNPDWQARYGLFQHIFGTHPYGLRHLGSIRTLSSLTQSDVRDFARHHLARDNLVVAVAGDIKPRELGQQLDVVFGELPKHAKLVSVGDVVMPDDKATILMRREGTQTEILFTMPGPKNDSPDWYGAEIANYILGGGGFSSRLMQEVRDKRGLTYGISTALAPMEHAGLIVGSMAANNNKTAEALDVTHNVMHRIYADGVTDAEVAAAKDYLTGALPLALTSTDKISAVLVDMQLDRRSIDYLDHRNDLLRAVTTDDVNRAVERWFDPDKMNIVMVGKPEGVVPTRTQEMMKE